MRAAVRIGNAISTRRLVTSEFHTKIGIRNIVMPGARRQTIVVAKLTAPRMVPRPLTASPAIHRFGPAPGEWTTVESGVEAYQPKSAAPPGVMKPAPAVSEPKRKSQ